MVDKIKFRIKIRIGNRGTGWISVPFLFKMEEMMKKIIDCLKEKMTEGFGAAGYDEKYAMVSVSNRPDLCQYQCNGAMAAAKEYKKAPIQIANGIL